VKPVIREEIYPLVASAAPEAVFHVYNKTQPAGTIAEICKQANACLIGCGSQKTAFTRDVLLELIHSYRSPLVIDADGINSVCSHIDIIKERTAATVLTPHPGEMARLLGESVEYVQQNRIRVATEFAREYGVVVVLKGAGTVIANPSGEFALSLTGNSGLSKGGSGDVLAGMITSFLAQGLHPFESACVAVWLHGAAADLAKETLSCRGMLPSDLIETLPALFLKMETE
jgi:NAD(P)H-hydrate epimerase